MIVLAIEHEQPGLTPTHFQPHLRAEALRAWQLHQSGSIRALYFCPERSAAVLMLECDDLDEARRLLDTLPLVQAGLITFELLALAAYPGFARLFASDSSPQ